MLLDAIQKVRYNKFNGLGEECESIDTTNIKILIETFSMI
jgi:hypothetical protein